MKVAVFDCPSNYPSAFYGTHAGVGWWAKGSYGANNGIGPMTEALGTDMPTTREKGVFYLNSQTTFASFKDGTSNTVMIAELVVVPDSGGIGDFRGVMHYVEGPLYHHNYTPNSAVPDGMRGAWCVSTPYAPCAGTYSVWKPKALTMSARSAHSGGVNIVMGDASVRFVSDSIDLAMWKAAGTMRSAAGEPIFTGF